MASAKRSKSRSERPTAATQREQRIVRTEGARGTSVVKLSDPAARHDVAALERKITSSRQQATAFLREAGLMTPTGRLTKRFGGGS